MNKIVLVSIVLLVSLVLSGCTNPTLNTNTTTFDYTDLEACIDGMVTAQATSGCGTTERTDTMEEYLLYKAEFFNDPAVTVMVNPMEHVDLGNYIAIHSSNSIQNVPFNEDTAAFVDIETIAKEIFDDLHSINTTPYSFGVQFQFENNLGTFSIQEMNFEQQLQLSFTSTSDFATLYADVVEDLVIDIGQDTSYDKVSFNPVCSDYAVLISIDVTNQTYYHDIYENQLSVTPATIISLIDATFTPMGYTYLPPQ